MAGIHEHYGAILDENVRIVAGERRVEDDRRILTRPRSGRSDRYDDGRSTKELPRRDVHESSPLAHRRSWVARVIKAECDDVGRIETPEILSEREDVGYRHVREDMIRKGAVEGFDAGRIGEGAHREELGFDGFYDEPLPHRPIKVVRRVATPGVLQSGGTVERLESFFDGESHIAVILLVGIFIVHEIRRHVHLDTPEDIDRMRESVKIYIKKVVDRLSRHLRDFFCEQTHGILVGVFLLSDGENAINLAGAAHRILDIEIARYRKERHGAMARIERGEHDRIGEVSAVVGAAAHTRYEDIDAGGERLSGWRENARQRRWKESHDAVGRKRKARDPHEERETDEPDDDHSRESEPEPKKRVAVADGAIAVADGCEDTVGFGARRNNLMLLKCHDKKSENLEKVSGLYAECSRMQEKMRKMASK